MYAEKKILLTHGHEFYVDFEFDTISIYAKKQNCSIVVFGHTHVPLLKEANGILLINPGSTSRPRMGSKKKLCCFNNRKKQRTYS